RVANALFARALAPGFTLGEDDLEPLRPAGAPGPRAELLHVEAAGKDAPEAEANAVARRIAALLASGAARGGEVAILLRAFTHLDAFRRALLGRRIPHLVWQGRGFHAAREVQDLLALLSLCLDPDDPRALATVARSPLGGPLSDEALFLLAGGRRLHRAALGDAAISAKLAADDARAARRLDALLARLQRSAARLGPC